MFGSKLVHPRSQHEPDPQRHDAAPAHRRSGLRSRRARAATGPTRASSGCSSCCCTHLGDQRVRDKFFERIHVLNRLVVPAARTRRVRVRLRQAVGLRPGLRRSAPDRHLVLADVCDGALVPRSAAPRGPRRTSSPSTPASWGCSARCTRACRRPRPRPGRSRSRAARKLCAHPASSGAVRSVVRGRCRCTGCRSPAPSRRCRSCSLRLR